MMRNLKFKYAKAENFLCFEHIELNFEKYGSIVLVTGQNLDSTSDDKSSSNGVGKCFGKNTKILMYDGSIKMVQDIRIGDVVMGNDSTPRHVLSLGRGRETMYRICPIKGDSYVVNKSHVLSLKCCGSKGKQYKKGNVINISVEDYLSSNKTFRHMTAGYRSGVEFNEQKVNIDPYFLGLWLGDGSSSEAGVATADNEILEIINKEANSRNLDIGINKNKSETCPTYRITCSRNHIYVNEDAIVAYKKSIAGMSNAAIATAIHQETGRNHPTSSIHRWVKMVKSLIPENSTSKTRQVIFNNLRKHNDYNLRNSLLNDLRYYDLINNKHIPNQYKINSRKIRLQMLAGLMDSDGHLSNGCYDFVNKNSKLANDVVFLARSLGLAAYVRPCYKKCQTGAGDTYFRVTISGNCNEIPIKLCRKQAAPRKQVKNHLVTGIKIEEMGIDDYYGFAVDGNHLFLLSDFTVVHNSSIPELPVYALYGKTIKKPNKLNHSDVINYKLGKKLSVEFCWDDYRVVRTRDPKGGGTLKLWKSAEGKWNKETEITRGGMPATQKYIEEIIGLNYNTFINLYIFNADDPTSTFLESDGPAKREIVENLLSLDKYRVYNENAKLLVKTANEKIKLLTKDYEHLLGDFESCRNRVAKVEEQEVEWRKEREKEVTSLAAAIKKKMGQLESSNTGAALVRYTEAQQQIRELQESIPALETKRNKLKDIIEIGTPKYKQTEQKVNDIKIPYKKAKNAKQDCIDVIGENEKVIRGIEEKVGGECPYCFGKVDKNNFTKIITKAREVIIAKKAELETLEVNWNKISKESDELDAQFTKLQKGLTNAHDQLDDTDKELTSIHASISELSKVKEPQAGVEERLIQDQIDELKKQFATKKQEAEGPSPFREIHDAVVSELANKTKEAQSKKSEIEQAEKELPYYDFWVKAFGDNGIRKYIIEGIIPVLNNRITYWLQILIDNKISLVFDNQLKETIDRYPFLGRPYVYHGCSGGQRRRLNLSVAASFAYIQLLNVGCCPSAIWLDEVSMNMDEIGVDGIYRMICELAKERQVFVIDHNQTLLQMLDGCDKIQLVMEDELARKIN